MAPYPYLRTPLLRTPISNPVPYPYLRTPSPKMAPYPYLRTPLLRTPSPNPAPYPYLRTPSPKWLRTPICVPLAQNGSVPLLRTPKSQNFRACGALFQL